MVELKSDTKDFTSLLFCVEEPYSNNKNWLVTVVTFKIFLAIYTIVFTFKMLLLPYLIILFL